MRYGEPILALSRRYGLVTIEAAQAALNCSANAAVKRLGRLCRAGRLRRFPLIHPRSFWAQRQLGPQALPTAFGALCYCLLAAGDERCRLLPAERRERWPWLVTGGEVVCSATATLHAVRADLGGQAAGVVRKARRFHRRNGERPEFRALCEGKQFVYVILTATPEQARAIERSLNLHAWPFPLKVTVIPDLFFLVSQ